MQISISAYLFNHSYYQTPIWSAEAFQPLYHAFINWPAPSDRQRAHCHKFFFFFFFLLWLLSPSPWRTTPPTSVFVCVCVCVWGRERQTCFFNRLSTYTALHCPRFFTIKIDCKHETHPHLLQPRLSEEWIYVPEKKEKTWGMKERFHCFLW